MTVEGLLFNTPATWQRIESLLLRLAVDEASRVLDVGCGRGKMLEMLAETRGCSCVGVDSDEEEIAVARARSPSRGLLTWHAADIGAVDLGDGFDAAICVGATHAFGPPGKALERTLETMRSYVKREGRLLVGEGYWRRDPPKAYLGATPFEREHLVGHESNQALAESAGWTLIHSEVSSVEEWDEFESAFLLDAEAWFSEAPEDDTAIKVVKHWRSWNAAYQRWGRETLGFGYYVLQNDRADHAA